jgi:two-component system chemotaxis response regulator CheY
MRTEQSDDSTFSKQLSILVVDDSIVTRSVLRTELTDAGFVVATAQHATEAMDALGKGEHFDLIITDFHMPGLDGAAFVGQVRHHPRYQSVPILVLTAGADDDEKRRARTAGASGWIVKPFDREKLTRAIRMLVYEQ